jgi:hypothetical protein
VVQEAEAHRYSDCYRHEHGAKGARSHEDDRVPPG